MKKIVDKNCNNSQQRFSEDRRFRSLIFFSICCFIGILPHFTDYSPPLFILLFFSVLVFFYGTWVLSKNSKIIRSSIDIPINKKLPNLDIVVAARDEQYVISRLVERLFDLDYPSEQLNIYIIDDGSIDETPIILKKLAHKYKKLKIISREKNAGGGKSGALNHALKFTTGEWLFILDADAQFRNDILLRLFHFAFEGSWSAVQLRKSVLNTNKNFLTNCQAMEMAMDTVFQLGRLSMADVSELRGNGQLIKKNTLLTCGAFNEDTVTDDLDLSFRLLISDSKIGILWDPPIMEEAVENIPALFSQRQRWAEGGLQRFFDYGTKLLFGNFSNMKKFDLSYFFILQYALPIISLFDLTFALYQRTIPIYWPISLTAFTLSAIASWIGCNRDHEGPTLPNTNLLNMFIFLCYLSHWFVIIPWVTFKMSILPKRLYWKKTVHKG